MKCEYYKGWEPEKNESIFEGNNIRYVLGKKGKNPFVIICMNPSKANLKVSDKTVNMAIEFARNNNYDGYYILNIYPEYATDSCEIEKIKKDIVDKNCDEIEKLLKKIKPKEIVLSYGDMDKCKKIEQDMLESKEKIKSIIKKYKVPMKYFSDLTGKGNPRHLGRLAKSKMKLSLFLVLLMLVIIPVVTACGKSDNTSNDSGQSDMPASSEDAETYVPHETIDQLSILREHIFSLVDAPNPILDVRGIETIKAENEYIWFQGKEGTFKMIELTFDALPDEPNNYEYEIVGTGDIDMFYETLIFDFGDREEFAGLTSWKEYFWFQGEDSHSRKLSNSIDLYENALGENRGLGMDINSRRPVASLDIRTARSKENNRIEF